MSSIPYVSEAMMSILTERATALERPTGFVQRQTAHLDGAAFVQTLVFGWLSLPQASYSQLRHVAASLGVSVSKQAVEQRFGDASVQLLRQLLEEAAAQVMASDARVPDLLARFQGVFLQDGTKISLPEALAAQWPGTRSDGSPKQGSLQVQVRLDLAHGAWAGLWLQHGRERETSGAPGQLPLPVGSLWNVDSGYRNLAVMRALGEEGRFWIMPPSVDLVVVDAQGVRRSLKELLEQQPGPQVDLDVCVGATERLPVRLVAMRVDEEQAQRRRQSARGELSTTPKGAQRPNARKQTARSSTGKRNHHGHRHWKRWHVSRRRRELLGWTIVLTNVPRRMLSGEEVVVVHRCRWQVELLWKLSKEIERVDTWRSEKPARILSEIFAKWLGLLISHWIMLVECWGDPRHSTVKAHQVVQWMAPVLAVACAGLGCLEQAVACSAAAMRRGCQVDPRRKRPATYQLLEHPHLMCSTVELLG